MRKLFSGLLLIPFFALSFPGPALADRDFRLEITLTQISSDHENVHVEVFLRFGAEFAPLDRPLAWERTQERTQRNRGFTSIVELSPVNYQLPGDPQRAFVFGLVRDLSTNAPVRLVPVTVFDLTDADPIEVEVRTVADFAETFRASYPFVYGSDEGFITNDTARTTLYALRLLLEFAAIEGEELTATEWDRLHSFFHVNRRFFNEGNTDLILETLAYLRSYSGLTTASGGQKFHAEFLNQVLEQIPDRSIDNLALHDRVIEDLRRLYSSRLATTFSQADQTLEALLQLGRPEDCVSMASLVLRSSDDTFLSEFGADPNVAAILREATECGQALFAASGGNSNDVARAARSLAEDPEAEEMMRQFIRVFSKLDQSGFLNPTETRLGELLFSYLVEYRKVLQP